MKKFGLVIAIVAVIAIVFAGCASGGGGGGRSGSGQAPYIVDLSKMVQYSVTNSPDKLVAPVRGLRNLTPITKNWTDVMYLFPEDMPDVTGYSRVTVTVKYFNASGDELPPRDSMGMASMILDTNGDWRGPEMGSGPNHAFKEFNVGGFSGMLHKDRGVRVGLKKNPAAILIQAAQDRSVFFIELSGVIFHNGDFKFDSEQPQGEGPEGS